jgi:prepilin-type processing-associated H-X9-DG protein
LHPKCGNIAFADGHIEAFNRNHLNSVFAHQPSATNRLAVP